jgi:hypothetical protein
MGKNITVLTVFLSICLVGFLSIPTYTFKPSHKPQNKVPKKDRMDLAWAQENEMTMDPELGYVPKDRLLKAFEYKEQLKHLMNIFHNKRVNIIYPAVEKTIMKEYGGSLTLQEFREKIKEIDEMSLRSAIE